jgi:outer membrane biosynthesis protein TonB
MNIATQKAASKKQAEPVKEKIEKKEPAKKAQDKKATQKKANPPTGDFTVLVSPPLGLRLTTLDLIKSKYNVDE